MDSKFQNLLVDYRGKVGEVPQWIMESCLYENARGLSSEELRETAQKFERWATQLRNAAAWMDETRVN
ncbi:MAG: hypothetical protein AB1813_22195 [Verrucomicrobiota bacterium]